jgi:hypothetical protein
MKSGQRSTIDSLPGVSSVEAMFDNAHVVSVRNVKIRGGSVPAPPAENVVFALCVRILSTLTSVFASLFIGVPKNKRRTRDR